MPLGRDWDVAIVGAGIGGLIAGAVLARRGLGVLLLEAGERPGGYLASFRRHGVVFDSCVDSVGSVFEADGTPGILGSTLEAAGVLSLVSWVRLDPIRVQRFPDFEFTVTARPGETQEQLEALFPKSRFALRRVFRDMSAIHARARRALGLPVGTDPAAGFRDLTFGSFVKRMPLGADAAAALGSFATFLGMNPATVSTRAMADLWMSYLDGGGWRVVGGFGQLVEALARRIEADGGRLLTDCPVTGAVRNQQRWHLETDRGPVVARNAIWAGAPRNGVEEQNVSSSFVVLYAVLEEPPLALPGSLGHFPSVSLESFLKRADPWAGAGGLSRASTAAKEGALNTESVTLHWPLWPSSLRGLSRERVRTRLLEKLRMMAPDARVRWATVATPATLERFTRNPHGAAYGWEQSPGAIRGVRGEVGCGEAMDRAGHWAGLGGGIIPSAISGWRAAQRILDRIAA